MSNEIAIPEEGVPEHLWLRVGPAYVVALRAELAAVRAERDEAEARGRADERAAVVAWLRDPEQKSWRMVCRQIADDIERGEHEVKP